MKSNSQAKKPISIKVTHPDESEDEIYNEFKELQKRQKKDARDRLKVIKTLEKDIKSSTPTHTKCGRKKVNPVKSNLFLEISPIRQNASNTELTQIEDKSSLQVITTTNNEMTIKDEPSNVQELKNLIAHFQLNRELSAMNKSASICELNIDSILREIGNHKQTETCHTSGKSPPAKIEKIERKKTVFFAPTQENRISSPIKLKPGKWRKSLAAWRKSHAPAPTTQRRTSRRFVHLFPIRTDPGVLKRFTKKFEDSLAHSRK